MIKIKTTFLGSGDFASLVLDKISSDFENINVITQNNHRLPIIKSAAKKNIALDYVNTKDDLYEKLKAQKPEAIILCDFGIILTGKLLNKFSPIINIHPSILPLYRGCSPIVSAILNGDEETGVSLMKMTNGIDEGPIYAIKKLKIENNDTNTTLSHKLSDLAQELISSNIEKIYTRKIKPKDQNNSISTLCTGKISKNNGLVNLNETAEQIRRKVRAYTPWPSVFIFAQINNKKIRLKIIEAEVVDENLDKDPLTLKTSKNFLKITKLQPEGKKVMTAKDFNRGYKITKIL